MRLSSYLQDNSINQTAVKMDDGMKAQSGQGLIVSSYCQGMIQQPYIDFGGFDKLTDIQKRLNDGLITAKAHANYYLGELQPKIITNITNINNYYNLHSTVPTILPSGSTVEQWINLLQVLEKQAKQYSGLAKDTADEIGVFVIKLGEDASTFSKNLNDLNAIVGGNEGVLKELEKQIDELDSKIGGAIAGIAISGVAIVGGIFLVAVGTVAGFVTAGTSAPIAVIGGVLIVGGVAGAVGSSIALANLIDAKSEVLKKQQKLTGEVKAIEGMYSNYNSLFLQVKEAQTASLQMKNAWDFLSGDLNELSNNLKNGILSPDEIRELWLTAANNAVLDVKNDINIIKAQMTGVATATALPGDTLANFIKKESSGDIAYQMYRNQWINN